MKTDLLPRNIEAEKATLGSMLLDPLSIFSALPLLKSQYFYDYQNRLVFEAITDLVIEDAPVDMVTVTGCLKSKKKLDDAGGSAYLLELIDSTPTSLHIEYYANLVKRYAKLREIAETARKVYTEITSITTGDIQTVLDKSSDLLYNSLMEDRFKDSVSQTGLMDDFMERFMDKEQGFVVAEVSTGFPGLDVVTGGYNASDLFVVAGRPSWGKTSFVMSSMLELAKSSVPSLLFSYEMSQIQTAERFVSMSSGVPLMKVRSGTGLTQEELDKVVAASLAFNKYPVYIDTNVGDIYYLVSVIKSHVQQHKVRVVAIDYLQIIPMDSDNLVIEIGKITRMLKTLAVSLDITIILVSQLNRSVEHRDNKKPRLADLRQSGRIEEDADVVLFVVRDTEGETPEDAKLFVGKNRNGPAGGSLDLDFQASITRFRSRPGIRQLRRIQGSIL